MFLFKNEKRIIYYYFFDPSKVIEIQGKFNIVEMLKKMNFYIYTKYKSVPN